MSYTIWFSRCWDICPRGIWPRRPLSKENFVQGTAIWGNIGQGKLLSKEAFTSEKLPQNNRYHFLLPPKSPWTMVSLNTVCLDKLSLYIGLLGLLSLGHLYQHWFSFHLKWLLLKIHDKYIFNLSFCQVQFKFSTSSVQFELSLSLKPGYYHPHPHPHPPGKVEIQPLLDYLGHWNLVWNLYSTKLGQLAN